MGRKKDEIEFRYYHISEGEYILPLLGERWRRDYGWNLDYLHFHNYIEIGYCYEGEGLLVFDKKRLKYEENDFTIIPKNYLHTTTSNPDKVTRWEFLFIDAEGLLTKIYAESPKKANRMLQRINAQARLIKAKEYPALAEKVRNILEIMRNKEEFYQAEAEGIVFALLAELARINTREGLEDGIMPGETKNSVIVSRALEYISTHFADPIRVEDLAEWCFVSETHFRRVFTSCMKMTPLEYINLVRIQNACRQLKKTDALVSDIAHKCGFHTHATFDRNFRKVMGCAPGEWRKQPENYEQRLFEFRIHSKEGP